MSASCKTERHKRCDYKRLPAPNRQVKEKLADIPDLADIKQLMADNGGEFRGAVDSWAKERGIQRLHTKVHDPHTNGAAERTVRY